MPSNPPPEGREPLDNAQLREAIRDILTELLWDKGPPTPPTGARAAVSPRAVSGARWKSRRQLVLGLVAGVLLAGGTVWALSWTGLLPGTREVPDELVGVWRTSDPPYADRAFKIGKTSIAFGTGDESYSVYPIKKVAVVRDPPATVYTIDYTTPDNQVAEFSISYVLGQEGVIRFKHQRRMVWTKAKP